MIFHIKQCSYCVRDKNKCLYRKSLIDQTKDIHKKVHVSHNCIDYKELFSPGEHVQVGIYNQFLIEDTISTYEWEWIKDVQGIIYSENLLRQDIKNGFFDIAYEVPLLKTDKPRIQMNKFYKIKLDKPINVTRVRDGKEVGEEIRFAIKTADKITRI